MDVDVVPVQLFPALAPVCRRVKKPRALNGACINITNSQCQMLPYNYTTITSVLSIVKSIEMEKFLKFFSYLNRLSCYQHIMLFGCSLALPECISDGDDSRGLLPCRTFCEAAKEGCEPVLGMHVLLQHVRQQFWGPKLNTVFEVRPHQCRVQGHDHFPSPAGHAISDTSQDAIGLFGHLGTLLAHIQAAVNQHPQVLFCQAAFQPLSKYKAKLASSPRRQKSVIVALFVPVKICTDGDLITESYRLEKTFKIIESNRKPNTAKTTTKPCPKHLIQTSFKYLQGWRLNHFPGQPVPMLDNPFSEVKFPNVQSKPPLAQLEAISSCPITSYLGEETDPHLSTTSFQAKQPQFPQLLLIRLLLQTLLLQTLHQLGCPSLDTLQHLNVSLVVRGPKLNTVFEVRPHQCRVQGHDHFPSPPGHTIFNTSQDAIGFLGHLGTLPAHIQPAVNQHPQVLFCRAAFQPLFPKPVALHGVAVAQVQDLALGLVKPHTIDLSPSIQPLQVPLQSLPPLKQINTPAHNLVSSANLLRIIDKDVKQNRPQHRALGNTACDRPPTGVNSIHHHSLGLAIQPVLYPAKSTPVQAMSSQFLQENAVASDYPK
ncbi:hypothetical protein QYF61_022632 [Mycteria americana]|uniref:FZ domain-containing protein n=1 Tax=Mycteria americana TaxID=33587 RepID=A0AAN7NNI0_MYCAM|nr:hypothetical protein QYF61_022632 [Mycteria americana]